MDFAKRSQEVFKQELTELEKVSRRIGNEMNDVVDLIYSCSGKVVVTGIGKTGIIGHKIASSLASTGTPSFFMNAAEAMHGDLGMIGKDDIVILMSHSGTTKETLAVIPTLKKISGGLIGFTSGKDSPLARESDYRLIYPKLAEADPLNLAPTVSSTMMLVLGDALACALSEKRDFTREDFHIYHPGGSLGEELKGDK